MRVPGTYKSYIDSLAFVVSEKLPKSKKVIGVTLIVLAMSFEF